MNAKLFSKIIVAGLFAAASLSAQLTARGAATLLTWDAAISGAPSDGSGNWLGGSTWWTGSADQAWVQGSHALIGNITPGAYSLVLGSPVTVGGLSFKTSSYTLSGSTLTMTNNMNLSNGVTAAITCNLSTPGTTFTLGNGGAALTLGGGYVSTTGSPTWRGGGAAVSTLNITNGTVSEGGTFTGDAITINQTGGAVSFSIWNIGRTLAGPAIWNLSGGTLTSPGFTISRGKTALLNVSGTGLLGVVNNLGIGRQTVTDDGTLNVLGGTVNIGTGNSGTPGVTFGTLALIDMLDGSLNYNAAAKATLNISGGTVTAKGILFGSAAGSYGNHPACRVTMTGGLLYLDSGGIVLVPGTVGSLTPVVTLSGGTLAATATWTGSVPMTLTNFNGDLTVQAADATTAHFNITLSGGLSGQGGLIKTGGGILTLSGANSYSGTTVVNNGQLTVNTAGATAIGPVGLTSGTTLSTVLASQGQSWANAGLALSNAVMMDFNFGAFQLSPSASVIRVNGDLTLDSSDPVTIEGSTLITGTFPLITCTGTVTLTGGASIPTITSLPAGVSAHLTQSGSTINLVVTASPNVFLKWGPLASGPWNFATTDWLSSGDLSATNYTDGIAVSLDDNATSAVTITLNTTVQPGNVTVNNTIGGTASYTITGTGSIGGNAGVLVQGTGLLALGTTNTYTGGTTVNAGTLAINYGGDGSGPTAIGTGPLTLNPGATIDNTSGANLVLNTPLTENWNGNFTYAGSQANLDLGSGPVVLGSSGVAVTVLSHALTCGGSITDNGLGYQLAVNGPGTLTLSGLNTYSGGTVLNSGKLNINNGGDGGADSAVGTGTFTINGGTIDNTSGSDVQFQTTIPVSWHGHFTFAGTGNLDLGAGAIGVTPLTLTLQNGATLKSEGRITAGGTTLTIAGNGTLSTGGSGDNNGLSVVVNGGVFEMNKASSSGVHSVGFNNGLTVNAGGTARITGTGGQQIVNSTLGIVTLGGGTLDLFGSNEKIYLINFNSGIIQNSSATAATLTMTTNINLRGVACKFDVTSSSTLTLPAPIVGTGSLIKLGEGALNLGGTNTYTGSTTISNGLLTITTATLANRNYTNAGGELEAILDPTGTKLTMAMSNLTFGVGVRLGFDLASGAFGDTVAPLIAAGPLTMNSNVVVDVSNAPGDTADDVLLTYTNRQGPGLFIAGDLPPGAFIYDNTASGTVLLTYTAPPPPSPAISTATAVYTGGVLSGVNIAGIHGPAGGSYHILSSTDVTLHPLSAWTPVQSGSFDSSGSFNITVSVNPLIPQNFYLVGVP